MDPVKKVVYISWMPLSDKVERDWYIADLRRSGVPVEYWDVTALLFPGTPFQESLPREFATRVADYQSLDALLAAQNASATNYLMLVNFEPRFSRLYRMLTRHGCRLLFFEWGNFPIRSRSRQGKLARLFREPAKFVSSVREKIGAAVSAKLGLLKPFDVVFAAGSASAAMHPRTPRIVPVNLCDYDNYILAKEKPRLVAGRFAVFLDINLAFQTDIRIVGWEYVSAERYTASLNRYFTLLEQEYGVEVVIAAHPKADYRPDYFQGRKILKGATPELVRDAEFVISHHSTSISYAVLNRKPLQFIYTDDMARIYADTIVGWLHDFAEYLHAPVLNIDHVTDPDDVTVPEPDPERYNSYKYNYLTSRESEHRLNREVVLAELSA